MDVLEVSGIGKKYKGFTLENISFTVPAGYIMGYVGRNGAGKTTTLELIIHQIKADSGTIARVVANEQLRRGKNYENDCISNHKMIKST